MKLLLFSLFTGLLMAETPKQLGYTFPDEWEKHAGTMMIFPAKHSYGKQALALQKEFANIACAIAKNEKVEIFCYDDDEEACNALLSEYAQIEIHVGDYRIDWARDNAPMVLRNSKGSLASAGFKFNGWGKKYAGWRDDVKTRDKIAQEMGWKIFPSSYVLEGGSIEIGGGMGIVTESCVLHKNRTDWSKHEVEVELKKMLGLEKIIWIKSGLMPDPITDGHVDGLLKFIDEDTVMLHTTDLKSDINYQICQDAKTELLKHGLKVVELPLMDDMMHMNYYIGSGGTHVYVPICGDPAQDTPCLEVIQEHFKHVIPIKANALAKAGGGIHCYTQQIPYSGN